MKIYLSLLLPILSLISIFLLPTCVAIIPPSVKSSTFLSPPFYLKPGSVANKYYLNIPFPEGHLALKSFDAEVIDEYGNPVPLHETYLHHWVVERYYGLKNVSDDGVDRSNKKKLILVRNSGLCNHTLGQYYGLGSETRKTDTWVPDPYGIEVGNPEKIPAGYEERWVLNVHAIDTRGVEDRLGCTECRCGLYNVTIDEYGDEIPANYTGGLYCCYDQTRCKVKEEFEGVTRKLYLRYTVMWVDWEPKIVPVKIYILDVTDIGIASDQSKSSHALSSCKVEYEVKACGSKDKNSECVDTKITRVVMPKGGNVVYGVAHQHSGGTGSALYGEDGRLLCASIPSYGNGEEAGNEENYIVGMSTCYPEPGSVKIADGEILTLISNYSNTQLHTGVMGLFYILVAEQQPPVPPLPPKIPFISWWIDMSARARAFLIAGAVLICIIGLSYYRTYRRKDYQPLPTDQ